MYHIKKETKRKKTKQKNKMENKSIKTRQCLHLVHFLQLQLQTDYQRLQTRQAGREKGRNTVKTDQVKVCIIVK